MNSVSDIEQIVRLREEGIMASNRIQPGVVLHPRELHNIDTERVRVPDREALVHLQFRRFAGCPVCNLHLRSFVERYPEITAASIREVIVFHSWQEELKLHA